MLCLVRIQLRAYLPSQYFLKVCCVLGAGDTAVNTTDKITCSLGVYILVGEIDN